MSTATAETADHKRARYERQNAGRPLTYNQLRRIRNAHGAVGQPIEQKAAPEKVRSTLAEQHAAVREEHPVTPQAAPESKEIEFSRLVDIIENDPQQFRSGMTYSITTTEAQLGSQRSKIRRLISKAGYRYSTQSTLASNHGQVFLLVHLEW
jgi:hypothetical protein